MTAVLKFGFGVTAGGVYWSEVADGCVVGTTTTGDVVRSRILQSYEDGSVRFDPADTNAAPESDPWAALCARLSLDTSASVEAVIAAARGRDAQPAPVRSERSVDVAPGLVALLRERTRRGLVDGDVVEAEFAERVKLGIARYGVGLTTFNGRDAARDALDEALDGIQYAEQLQLELAEIDPKTVDVERFRFARGAAEDARDYFIGAARLLVRARGWLR